MLQASDQIIKMLETLSDEERHVDDFKQEFVSQPEPFIDPVDNWFAGKVKEEFIQGE